MHARVILLICLVTGLLLQTSTSLGQPDIAARPATQMPCDGATAAVPVHQSDCALGCNTAPARPDGGAWAGAPEPGRQPPGAGIPAPLTGDFARPVRDLSPPARAARAPPGAPATPVARHDILRD